MALPHSLALEMAIFLVWNSVPGPPAALGVGAVSDRAYLNSTAASAGTTVYDGDQFSTEAGGMLLLHGDAATIELAGESVVLVRNGANGLESMQAELGKGTLVFRSTRAAALEIAALEALIRPVEDARTTGQVSILGPRELLVHARRGSLYLSYGGETQTIAQGESYRVLLDSPEDASQKKGTVKPARRRKAFVFVAIGGGAAGVATMVFENRKHKHVESPDHP